MGLQSMQNQDMSLVLSTDAKPRLKWTAELHRRFVEAVNQLGGADKATPKSLMREIGIPGLTLYHLKSHLQKFRLGKNQQSETRCDSQQFDYEEGSRRLDLGGGGINDAASTQINESLQIAQALKIQMEVQRKLHEQIEVQRHLQLRIEAQGKYLQTVLKKAQETLAGYNSSPLGVEHTKPELSQLVSKVGSRCPSSSFSQLIEAPASSPENADQKQARVTGCSMESSLTSSEGGSGRNEEPTARNGGIRECNETPGVLQLFDPSWITSSSDHSTRRKRSGSTDVCDEEPAAKRWPTHREKTGHGLGSLGLVGTFDLNSQYQNDLDLGTTDLSSRGIGRFNVPV
ncbi:hypothetical protein Nepgr_003570 [Nepenthes gracilis]|uniref:HTH myb-type domain-containing protein n=1 Tax=Nepenthes gracilis TaxID=150966 RepID=A0AAD3RZS0_NEPGR|nr:hypothetical protein Nepgr_003570 [Nepenthes gracilis]